MSAPWVSGGGVSGRVLERYLAEALLHGGHEDAAARAAGRCGRVWRRATETLGPASGGGAVWAHLVAPCAEALGWSPDEGREEVVARLRVRAGRAQLGTTGLLLVALPWGVSQDGLHRRALRLGVEAGAAWASVCNGTSWRWYDTTRPYAGEHLAIDLAQASVDTRVWHALWLLGRPSALHVRGGTAAPWIERLIAASASHVSRSAGALRDGVAETLSDLSARAPATYDMHVAQVFQWLFLLFAEARELLPVWQPAYRRSYALSSLAREAPSGGTAPVGLHDSLAALGRAGRDGMVLGTTRVAALNGPLFAATSLPSGRRLPDASIRSMLERLTHGGSAHGRHAIDFAELGVEHLGSLYEHLMAPATAAGRPSLLRKRTGAFYTPRPLADLLVQRTLEPLVRGAASEQILSLRVLDPAMGSGALLASALRYLTGAVEAAWVREGRGGALDVPTREREALPRRIAEQCLYGVDVNARAVQVARLSVWLLSLAPDRPLTWLDAHLREGNSLIGTSPALVLSRAPVRARAARPALDGQLTLFDLSQWHHEAAEVAPMLQALAMRPTESAGDAHDKTRALAALRARAVLASWRARADAWCGASMDATAVAPAVWRAVDDGLRGGAGFATRRLADCHDRWSALARTHGCLHWALEFPDVFDEGRGGFDAVIANPPWEMLRGDLGTGDERATHRDHLGPLLRFVRRSGVYRESAGHVNTYQLFVERMLQVLRAGGRIGCLLPGSMLVDHGAASLRRHVFDHASVDQVSVFANRDALFPIHRSMRIVCLTGAAGSGTEGVLVDDGAALEVRAARDAASRAPRLLPRALLRRASGDAESIPHLRDDAELRLLARLIEAPRLGDGGWSLRFGRELNATDDRALLRRTPCLGGLVVIDGKHVQPFVVRPPEDGPWVHEAEARRVLPASPWRCWRLAYRDVSSPTNTRSLIAALLPPGCVSTHTLFCLRTPVPLASQLYLCGMLNSLVADWFVRRYLGSHVTTRLIATVPVPRLSAQDARRRRVVRLVTRLMRVPDDERAAADLQALAARLHGLDARDFETVTRDFPRLSPTLRARMLDQRQWQQAV